MHKINFVALEKIDAPIEKVVMADVLTLLPNYDFFAPLRPVPVPGPDGRPLMIAPGIPKMAMGRDPIVTTRDFALKPYPVHVRIGAGVMFDFFSQMHEDDRKTYRGFIDAARDSANGESASQGGLALPSSQDIAAVEAARRG